MLSPVFIAVTQACVFGLSPESDLNVHDDIIPIEKMRRSLHRSLALLLPVLLFAGCTDLRSPHPVVVEGRAIEVRFPEPWIERTLGNEKVILPGGNQFYEIRKPADVPGNRLLFAGMSWVADERQYPGKKSGDVLYSENVYSVDLDKNYEVRTASGDEWQSAQVVSENARPIAVPANDKPGLDHNGIHIKKAGEYWGLASLSPEGKVLAVFSFSGKQTKGGIIPFMGGGVKTGDVYWDVYDARSGSRIVSWYAKSVRSPGGPNAVWVEDRYLVTTLQGGSNRIVIADLLPAH